MIFCGQCGLQLAPGTTRCPRCGTLVEGAGGSGEDLHSDDATIASPSLLARNPQQPNTPPLILRDGGNFNTQAAYDATSRAEAPPNYNTRMPTTNQNMGGSYPGYPPQQAGYPPQQPGYQTQQQSYVDYSTHGAGYPAQSGMSYQQLPQYQEEEAPSGGKLRVAALVMILLGLLLVLSAVVLFALQHNGMIAGGPSSGSTPPAVTQQAPTATPTQTATQKAEAVIQQYYDDINTQNYQDAYHLWKSYSTGYAAFQAGFKNTKHDQVTFQQETSQADGTVKLTVTVNATESSTSGDTTSVYTGYYVVGPQSDASWKITDGQLQKQG